MSLNFEDLPDVLTPREAAAVLRIGRNAVYEAIKRLEIQHFKIGRSIRVPKAGLIRLLAARVPDGILAHDLSRGNKCEEVNAGQERCRAQP